MNSVLAIWILAGLVIVLALIIPLLNSIEKLSNFISLRWSCIAIILLIMVGVVIDFAHLSDNTRDITLRGGLIIVGIFLVLRTIEKILYNGWLKGVNLKGTVKKGDLTATAEVSSIEKEDKKESVDTDKSSDSDNTLTEE